ncbi:hypothetical protein OSL69_17735 [Escherichia coli]|nr:hypothetical protein [Salmonella enterica]EKZ9716337.1 hypothetical protein [Klebsiella pneumoniae]MDA6929184.1 hypothetical protein [Escherichia coli]
MKQDAHFESVFTVGTFGADLGTLLPIVLGAVLYIMIAFLQHHFDRAKYLRNVLNGHIQYDVNIDVENAHFLKLLRQKHLALGWLTSVFAVAFAILSVYYMVNIASAQHLSLMMTAFLLAFCIHRTFLFVFLLLSARNENRELEENVSSDLYNTVFLKLIKTEGIVLTLNILIPFIGMIGFAWLLFRLI